MSIDILEKYKNRLINFNGRNQTLLRKKITANRAFDLMKLEKIDPQIIESIISSILNDDDKEILLLPRAIDIVLTSSEQERITEKFDTYTDRIAIQSSFSKEDIKIAKNDIESREYKRIYATIEQEIKNEKIEYSHNLSKNLDKLFSTIDSKEKETGLYELYIGFPFIEGKLLDSKKVRAPLIIFPSQIYKKNNAWYYKNANKEKIYVNKIFLMAYKDSFQEDISSIELEFEEVGEIFKAKTSITKISEYLEYCKTWAESNKIKIDNAKFKEYPEVMRDYKDADYTEIRDGELFLKNHFILGQYNIGSNSIYKDISEIIISENISESVINLLEFDNEVHETSNEENDERKTILKEQNNYFVTELDYSQEQAVKLSDTLGNLVIYGPPGTGKSQVITNIVADNLAKGKKVLVVSEKRTALDVVYKRLEKAGLNTFIGIAHDIKKDRLLIMQKIESNILNADSLENTEIEANISNISTNIQDSIDILDEIALQLHKDREFGCTLFAMYSRSRLELGIIKELADDFDKYKKMKEADIIQFLKVLFEIKDFTKYDGNELISRRKGFNEFSSLEEIELKRRFSLLKTFNNINSYLDESTNLYHKVSSVDIHDEWINLNPENRAIYLEVEKMAASLNEYDIYIKNRNDFENKYYSRESLSMKHSFIDQLRKWIIGGQITLSDIEKLEDQCKEMYQLSNYFNKIIMDTKISDIWKKQNNELEFIFENLNEICDKYKEYKNLSFISLKKYKLRKEITNLSRLKIDKNFTSKLEKTSTEKKAILELNFNIESNEIDIKNKILLLLKNSVVKLENAEKLHESHERTVELSNSIIKSEEQLKEKINEKIEFSKEINILNGRVVLLIKTAEINDYISKFPFESNYDGIKEKVFSIVDYKVENSNKMKILTDFRKSLNEKIEVIKSTPYLSENLRISIDDEYFHLENYEKEIIGCSIYFKETRIIEELKNSTQFALSQLIETILNDYSQIKQYDLKKIHFTTIENSIFSIFLKDLKDEFFEKCLNTFYLKWIEAIEKETFSSLLVCYEYDNIRDEILLLANKKKELVPKFILSKAAENIRRNFKFNRLGNEIYFRNIQAEARKKKNKKSLREFIELFSEQGIFDILPCWLLTPEVASEILPLKNNLFDIVIFDEASQLFVEKSIPAIFRGKKIIVAGDDKQLKPNDIGMKKENSENDDDFDPDREDEYVDDSAQTMESLLDLAKERYKHTLLQYHYRAQFPELINFSNYAFYNAKLIIAPNSKTSSVPPIEVIKVDGVWDKQCNIEEAKKAFEVVKKILNSRKNNESIGIVTFNAKQQELIQEYFEDKCEKDEEFRMNYECEKSRYDGTEDKSLFVKNIENVQGDERDIIIFSIAYARDAATGRIYQRFGTLGQEGGENRLNVAISRAKTKIFVITSIEPEELKTEMSQNEGPKLLKKYLQYSRAVSNMQKEHSLSILNTLPVIMENISNQEKFDSPLEVEIHDKIVEKGYTVHTQIGDSGYRIDLAIYDEKIEKYILGIECDGAMYHSSPSARERDIFRQKFLEQRGWIMHRIWSKNWWANSNDEIRKLVEKIERIRNSDQRFL